MSLRPFRNIDRKKTKVIKRKTSINRIRAGKYKSSIAEIEKAIKKYTRDVKLNRFPSKKNYLNGSK